MNHALGERPRCLNERFIVQQHQSLQRRICLHLHDLSCFSARRVEGRHSVVRIASDRQFYGVYGTRSNSLWTFATMRSSIDGANGPGWTMVVK